MKYEPAESMAHVNSGKTPPMQFVAVTDSFWPLRGAFVDNVMCWFLAIESTSTFVAKSVPPPQPGNSTITVSHCQAPKGRSRLLRAAAAGTADWKLNDPSARARPPEGAYCSIRLPLRSV